MSEGPGTLKQCGVGTSAVYAVKIMNSKFKSFLLSGVSDRESLWYTVTVAKSLTSTRAQREDRQTISVDPSTTTVMLRRYWTQLFHAQRQ